MISINMDLIKTQLNIYLWYIGGSGKKIGDVFLSNGGDFRELSLKDTINGIVFLSTIGIAIFSITKTCGLIAIIINSLMNTISIIFIIIYILFILLAIVILLFQAKCYIFDKDLKKNSGKIKTGPSFFVGPYHPSVFLSIKSLNEKIKISGDGGFYCSHLRDGSYNCEFYIENGNLEPMQLKKTTITKSGKLFKPDFIDLSSSLVEVSFRAFDKPVSNSDVKGEVDIKNGNKVILTSKTDEKGKFSTLLPECKYTVTVEGKVDGKPIKISEHYEIQKPLPISNLEDLKKIKPKSFERSQDCADYNIKTGSNKTVYLPDISGSMGGQSMDILKINLKKLIGESNGFYAIAPWNHSIEFYSEKWVPHSSNTSGVVSWIDGLQSTGGTDIKQAIEEAIKKYSDADEFFVLCDGDTSAFPDMQSWSTFYSKNSKYIINFVGIGGQSDERMKSMAQISKGKFTKIF
ncbi:hypothetical protein RB653_008494 [Dictyostelium firmibasis]|uniref:VWFA domain-containing protein n=1 Tax=Dictyostelium firmibasis TaxID=79012 RepID=A0AAN7YR74_9MYCE